MKIKEKYISYQIETLSIESAIYLNEYLIEITFNDGSKQTVDFKEFLNKSHHTSITKYLEVELFSKFEIINGNLNWNDYELIFPIGELYDGKIKL